MTATSTPAPASQTLSRGIRMLEILAEANGPMTIAELSSGLGVHRSIAYRILRTLESHRLVTRDESGRVHGAPGLAVLASSVQRDLQSAALPELTLLANELKMCAFIAVWDQPDCTTLVTVEPRHVHAAVVQRPGSRHPFGHGAPGIAMQSTLTEDAWNALNHETGYRQIATTARTLGYATSIDEVIPGLSSVAAPIMMPGQLPAAVAVVYSTGSEHIDVKDIGERIKAAARAIEAELG
jgi:DNA-binding IclR family transcriptional regulator